MSATDGLLHLLGFLAPAFWVGLLLAGCARFFMSKQPSALVWWVQAAINFAAGGAALAVVLVWRGHDGTMLGYGALVLAVALAQWLGQGGWRDGRRPH